jgi:NhaP-type Na+/H+ or K+/H+ antiporter
MADTILGVGIALLAASLFIALFRRTRIPDVLLLILVGLGLGPFAGWVQPSDFGKVGSAVSTIALTVILFESGLTLDVDALRRSARLTLALTLAGFLTTGLIAATFARFVLQVDVMLACVTGAIVAGTSSAVVIPLLQELGLSRVVGTALAMESALTDVLSIVVAYACLNAAAAGTGSVVDVGVRVLLALFVAMGVGGAAAVLFLFVARQVRALPNASVGVIAAALIVFGAAERLGASGAIASLSFGFVMANVKWLRIGQLVGFEHVESLRAPRYLKRFLGDVIFMLKTFFFVFLGISMQIDEWKPLAWSALVVLCAYGARAAAARWVVPLTVTRQEVAIVAVMAPKGLAAAVLAGVPTQLGLSGGPAVQQFVYGMVLASIVVTSAAVPLMHRWPFSWGVDALFRRHARPTSAASES